MRIKKQQVDRTFLKNLCQLLALVMVPALGVVLLGYFSYHNLWRQELYQQSQETSEEIAAAWEAVESECRRELVYISSDDQVSLFLLGNSNSSSYDLSAIQKLLSFPLLTCDYVKDMHILNLNTAHVLDRKGVMSLAEHEDRMLFVGADTVKNGMQLQLFTIDSPFLLASWRTDTKNKQGILSMKLSVQELQEHFDAAQEDSYYIIADGYVLLSDNIAHLGLPASDLPGYTQATPGIMLELPDSVAQLQRLDGSGIEVLTLTNKSAIQARLQPLQRFLIIFVLSLVVLTIFLAVRMAMTVYYPLGEIIRHVRSSRELEEAQGFDSRKELESILKSTREKAYFDEDVAVETVERLKHLKKAQAVALQSQINPHFLNNTLETLNYMAMESLGRENAISDMVNALANMLRSSLGRADALIPLQEELEHCHQYLKIQNVRYQDRFDVVWDIAEDVTDCRVIRIILQPILENAIYHGVKHLSSRGRITISAKRSQDKLHLEVRDNGLGMPKSQVEALYSRMQQDVIQVSNHIGLANVYQRLKLYYGEDCEMKIQSKMGAGTSVILILPL